MCPLMDQPAHATILETYNLVTLGDRYNCSNMVSRSTVRILLIVASFLLLHEAIEGSLFGRMESLKTNTRMGLI